MQTRLILMLLGALVLTGEEAQGIQIQNQVLTESSTLKKSHMRSKDDVLGGQMLATYSMSQNVMQDNWNDISHRIAKGKWFIPEFFSWFSCSIFHCATPEDKPLEQESPEQSQRSKEEQQQSQQDQKASQDKDKSKNGGSSGSNEGAGSGSGDQPSDGSSQGGGGSSGGGSTSVGSSSGGASSGSGNPGLSGGGASTSSPSQSGGGGAHPFGGSDTAATATPVNGPAGQSNSAPSQPTAPPQAPNNHESEPYPNPDTLQPVAQGSTQVKKSKAHIKASKSVAGSDDGVGDEEIDKNIVKYDSPKDEDSSSSLLAHKKHHHHKQERHQNIYMDPFFVQKSNQTLAQKPQNATR